MLLMHFTSISKDTTTYTHYNHTYTHIETHLVAERSCVLPVILLGAKPLADDNAAEKTNKDAVPIFIFLLFFFSIINDD